MSVEIETLAFMTMVDTNDGEGVVGAALLTNEQGFPLEFRATTSVRPTQVQKVLYGGSLDSYLAVEICGMSLLEALQRDPDVVLVNQRGLLGLSRITESPVTMLERAGESIRVEGDGDEIHRLSSTNADYSQVVMQFALGRSSEEESEVRQALSVVFNEMDLLEPFERAVSAVSALASQESRFG